jgi:hypothetical protein
MQRRIALKNQGYFQAIITGSLYFPTLVMAAAVKMELGYAIHIGNDHMVAARNGTGKIEHTIYGAFNTHKSIFLVQFQDNDAQYTIQAQMKLGMK